MKADRKVALLGLVLLVPAFLLVSLGLLGLQHPAIVVEPVVVMGGLLLGLGFNLLRVVRVRLGHEADAVVGTIALRVRGTALNLAAMGLGFTLLAIITVYLFVENFQPRLLE